MNGSVAHLALPITWLAPELVRLVLPEEAASSCASCPMAGRPFLHDVRCCTYEPSLANFLVGRALRRGGSGGEKMMARVQEASGRTGWGMRPRAEWLANYRSHRETGFGRRREWACPYWEPGPLACSIWRDRSAVCRTWHCKHDDGIAGHQLWVVVRGVIGAIEDRLARLCEGDLGAPDGEADAEIWAGYYLSCAELVEQLEAADLLALEDEELLVLRGKVREVHAQLAGPMPEVLAPKVSAIEESPDGVELVGYSPWNGVELPASVFVLLAEMDGRRPWREAVQRARRLNAEVEEAWVERLWRHGVLREPGSTEVEWGFEGPELDPGRLAELLDRG